LLAWPAPSTARLLLVAGNPWLTTVLLAMPLIAAAVAAGCQARPPKEAEGRTIVRPKLGLAIDVPQGWAFRDLYGDVVLEMYPQAPLVPAAGGAAAPTEPAAKPQGPSRLPVVVHVVAIDRAGIDLAEWADQAVKDSRELQPDLAESYRQTVRLADGREALTLTLTSPRGVQPVVQRMLLAVTAKRAYAVLATAPESELAAAEPAFKTCFDSFSVW
jgi:hypothetical protein